MSSITLTRVLVRDEQELQDVLDKKSLGVSADCWHLIDPAQYSFAVREILTELHRESDKQKHDAVIDNCLMFFRIWPIDDHTIPSVRADAHLLSDEPLVEADLVKD